MSLEKAFSDQPSAFSKKLTKRLLQTAKQKATNGKPLRLSVQKAARKLSLLLTADGSWCWHGLTVTLR
ncbi:hypothetical protein [Deinococcus misasensis]|uniref:hypothetical protein n=1 Tax=Deinococcus misasensis TaxID=392413 RepID=UPI000555F598|nr:hypothetical protein [Deinococcus misasensis]